MVDMRHNIVTWNMISHLQKSITNHKPYSIVDWGDDTPAVKITHKSFNHDAINDSSRLLTIELINQKSYLEICCSKLPFFGL